MSKILWESKESKLSFLFNKEQFTADVKNDVNITYMIPDDLFYIVSEFLKYLVVRISHGFLCMKNLIVTQSALMPNSKSLLMKFILRINIL